MTEAILQYLANVLKTNLTFLDEIQYVGRKSIDGYTLAGKDYVGITDRKGQYGYFRITGEQDHKYSPQEGPTSKGKWFKVEVDLRLVLCVNLNSCGSLTELEQAVLQCFNGAEFPPANFGKVLLLPSSSSTDFERIFIDETDQERPSWNDAMRLLTIDFTLQYNSNECCQVQQPAGDCPPVTCSSEVRDHRGGVIATLECDEDLDLLAVTVKNHKDQVLNDDLAPGEEYIVPAASINNHRDELVTDQIAPNDVWTLSPAVVESEQRVGPNSPQALQAPNDTFVIDMMQVEDVDEDGIAQVQYGEKVRINHDDADIVVDQGTEQGVTIITVNAGGGIIPAYIVPERPTATYHGYDLKAQYDDGVFDRGINANGERKRLGADNYTLDAATPNKYGTTHRLTLTNEENAWTGTNFLTTGVGALDYVIEDHYRNIRWYVANLGQLTWSGAVDAAAALAIGGFAWRLPCALEFLAAQIDPTKQYYDAQNLFRRNAVSGYIDIFAWTSDTREFSPGTAAYRMGTLWTKEARAKTDSNLITAYACCNFDD